MKKLILIFLFPAICLAYVKAIDNFNGGQATPLFEARIDVNQYDAMSRTMENMQPLLQGPVVKRPGTKYVSPIAVKVPATLTRDITMAYISENGTIWGIPFTDANSIIELDAGAMVKDYGSGKVGLPCYLHPFKAGQTINIRNAGTYYNGNYIVQPETTANDIVILSTFYLYYLPAGKTVIIEKTGLASGIGRMTIDKNGNLYVGINGVDATRHYCVKVSGDFLTTDNEPLHPETPWADSWYYIAGIKVTDDGNYLYLYLGEPVTLYKFNISDGNEVWHQVADENKFWLWGVPYASNAGQSYDIAVNEDDSVYLPCSSSNKYIDWYGASNGSNVSKFLSDGTFVDFNYPPPFSLGPGGIHVDNNMGAVIVGSGSSIYVTQDPLNFPGYNLAICSFDYSSVKTTRIGDLHFLTTVAEYDFYTTHGIAESCITTHNGFIYVADTTDDILYKLDTDLNILASVAVSNIRGVVISPYGTIIAVRSSYPVAESDSFWYYDDDLNSLGKATGISILGTWGPYGYMKGNMCFKTPIETIHSTYTYSYYDEGSPDTYTDVTNNDNVRLISLDYSDDDSFVAEVGKRYMRIYSGGPRYGVVLWSDGFESGNFTAGRWVRSSTSYTSVLAAAKYTGTYGAKISYYGWIQKALDVTGYDEITVKYRRQTYGLDTGESFNVEWSCDGITWHFLESIQTGSYSDGVQSKLCSISDSDDKHNFRIRFRTWANLTTEYTYVDDVQITGIAQAQITYSEPPPQQATNPVPANLATGVNIAADLSWTAALTATSHSVYFGTISPGTSQGEQTGITYDTGTMAGGAVYYWRIDEINYGGATTGNIWNFTTMPSPGQAASPSPADLAINVGVNDNLSWAAGSNATSRNVYFGTTVPPVALGWTTGITWNLPTLTGIAYYWRVDEIGAGGTTTGNLWSFSTNGTPPPAPPAPPGQASNPNPADAATDVSLTNDLSWTAGSDTTSHDVYFGTASSPPLISTSQVATSYDTGTMNPATIYSWRIDEKNAVGVTTGTVWSFTTVPPTFIELIVNAPATSASISVAGEQDWYSFVVPSTGTYTIETAAGTLGDTYMYLYGPDSYTTLIEEDDDDGVDYASKIVRSLTAGTYYVKIRAYSSSSTGTYTVWVASP